MHGLAFAIFYTVLGLPIGRWADRGNRRNIIVLGIAVWSLMTCLSGYARSFMALFAARVGVGIGEAALSPPAHSMLSDTFRPERLPAVFAFYGTGIILGIGFASVIGGELYTWFDNNDTSGWFLFGPLNAWQSTFIVVGAPGLLLALLMLLTVREPARKGIPQSASADEQPSIREVLQFIRDNHRVYASLIGGVALLSILGYALSTWYPEFLQRSYGLEKAEAGRRFGSLFLVAGLLGSILLALISQYFASRSVRDIGIKIVTAVALIEAVPAIVAPLMPSADLALLTASIVIALQYGHFGIAISALQVVTPNRMRAQVSAILLFCTNILGLIVGPTLVAIFTDYLFVGDQYLNYSLSLTSLLVAPLAALWLWSGIKHYQPMLDRAESANAGSL